jgi:hypothetical protein
VPDNVSRKAATGFPTPTDPLQSAPMPTPRWIAFAVVVVVLLASVQSIALAQPTTQPTHRSWDLTPGRQWRELMNEPAPTTQRSPEPVLDRVEQLLDRRE